MKKMAFAVLLLLCPVMLYAKCLSEPVVGTLVFLSTSDDGVAFRWAEKGSDDPCDSDPKQCGTIPCGAPGTACIDAPVGACMEFLVSTCAFGGLKYTSVQAITVLDSGPCSELVHALTSR